jgi:hypothetical protein
LPPIRRAGVNLSSPDETSEIPIEPPVAEFAAAAQRDPIETAELEVSTAAEAVGPVHTAARHIRRGSPFAEASGNDRSGRGGKRALSTPTRHSSQAASTGGAIAAVLLGMLSLATAYYFPIGALVTALTGLCMGVWGSYSQRKRLAIAGLFFCCLALALAGFFGAVELYTAIHGYSPWEAAPELDPDF